VRILRLGGVYHTSVGKADVSPKELIELRQNVLVDKPRNSFYETGQFKPLRWSLVDSYKCNRLSLHLHLISDDLKGAEYCIVLRAGRIEERERLPIDGLDVMRRSLCLDTCEQQPPVLIDVRELVENSQERLFRIPSVIRLHRLNQCSGSIIDSIKSPALDFFVPSGGFDADGETASIRGIVPISPYQFPYQIIETGTKITQAVTKNHGQAVRDRSIDPQTPINEPSTSDIRGDLWIGHETAGICLHVRRNLLVQKLEVMACPLEL